MSTLTDVKKIAVIPSGQTLFTINVGRSPMGAAIIELIENRPQGYKSLWFSSAAARLLVGVLGAALGEADALSEIGGNDHHNVVEPTSPKPEKGFLAAVSVGKRSVRLLKKVELGVRGERGIETSPAMVLAIHDDSRGELGRITLFATAARRLEDLLRYHRERWLGVRPSAVGAVGAAVGGEDRGAAAGDGEPDEELVPRRAEPRPPAELAPEPVRSRYDAPLPERPRRTAP